MNKTAKVLVTIGVAFLFIIIFGVIVGVTSDAGRTPGILGLIAFGVFIGAMKSIWKKDKSNKNNHNSFLQK